MKMRFLEAPPYIEISYVLCYKQISIIYRIPLLHVFKYHVSCTDGKISVSIKIGITFIFRFHRCPIQLIMFVPVDLSSFLRQFQQILLGVDVFCPHPTRSAENVVRMTKGLQEQTQLIEWDDGET
jgi:hypothetical protein